jgi:glycosyltransferase involved in cell wall biosynthesis
MSNQKTLFLFTKEFPYGNAEQYICEELELLAAKFNRVIIFPCELFENTAQPSRSIPPNVEVCLINEKVKSASTSAIANSFEKFKIFLSEFTKEKDKRRFIKEFKRYNAIFNHQNLLAGFMERYIAENSGGKNYFYAYWLHNSAVMLGIMRMKGKISNFISRAHSVDLYHNDWPLAYIPGKKVLPFQYFKTRQASAIYSISKTGVNYLTRKFPEMTQKFNTSYLGIDDHGEGVFDKNEIFTMVSCSGVRFNKRIPFIVDLLSNVDFKMRWIHFGDGPEMEKVKKKITDLPAHISVELAGHTPNEKVLEFYKKNTVHLFVNVSLAEGIPVAILEATSFGIPVMATNTFGNPEIVNENTGFLIEPDESPEVAAQKVTAFSKNLELQKKLRVTARHFVIRNFSGRKNLTEFVDEVMKWPS